MAGPRQRSIPEDERGAPGGSPRVEISGGSEALVAAVPVPPPETTELGIDIIRVSRIRDSLAKFGDRFTRRVLTPTEMAYVRGRPETMAGRWAAKEAVSKVLGLGVRGIGWRDIEVERLPTGQPAVKLHGRAARRAEQLGMGRIALSISHESEFAVAIAYGIRTAGGRFLFPPDIEERLNDREVALMRRFERLRVLARDVANTEAQLAAGSSTPAEVTARQEGTDA
ncbi:MAG: holo-ACP synthase [Candidatus Limnocylindrales bacterium]|jgi:holo-[acyl-carrier protein] synthase